MIHFSRDMPLRLPAKLALGRLAISALFARFQ